MFENLAEFRSILSAHQHLAANLQNADADQFTASMFEVRRLPLDKRIAYYVEKPIDNQSSWYSRKSKTNKMAFRFWAVFTVIAYVLAAISLNAEQLGIAVATYSFDPLIVVVTSAIG